MPLKKENLDIVKKKSAGSLKEIDRETPVIKILDQTQFQNISLIDCYRATIISSSSGFCIYDQNNHTFWVSQELLQLINLPYDSNTLHLLFNSKLFYFDDNQKLQHAIQEVLETKQNVEIELNTTNESDTKTQKNTFRCQISLIKEQPENKQLFLLIITDITKSKHFSEELAKAKEKTEESDRIKSIFLKNISHEIRTPMNAIIGFTELLNIGELSADKRKEYLSIIKNKSKYMLSLIDDIAELSKFESGVFSFNKSETNLIKIFGELHSELEKEKYRLNKPHIELYLKLPHDHNIVNINTDPGRLQQVLHYLLDNAIKFTEKGYIQFGYELKDNKNLLFFVKDTGIGIPKEAQKHLFNRFRQKEETFDKYFNNTGLGLTISRSIVELLGGKIYVESTLGQGTSFYFTIPLNKIDKTVHLIQEENKVLSSVNWRNKIILIAEDDDINFHFLEAVFADTQAQLIHVNNGKQAVEICKTIPKIDIILMDIKMPEKSGYEAIKEIKKFRKDIPIIVQTAYTQKEDKEKCMMAGCDDYISKPIDIELLISKTSKFLND
jgi:signal transduction histidine kinase